LVLFASYDAVNSETPVRPLDAKFGTDDGPNFRLYDSLDPSDRICLRAFLTKISFTLVNYRLQLQ